MDIIKQCYFAQLSKEDNGKYLVLVRGESGWLAGSDYETYDNALKIYEKRSKQKHGRQTTKIQPAT